MSKQGEDKASPKKTALDAVEVTEDIVIAPPKASQKVENPLSPEPLKQEEPAEEPETTEEEDYQESGYELFAKDLIRDGWFDETFEVKRGLTGNDIKAAFGSKLRKELEPTIKEQVLNELREMGASPEDIKLAQLMRQGTDINVLQNKVVLYDRLKNKVKDAPEEYKEAAVYHMYAEQGYKDRDIKTLIENAKEKEGAIDALYDESTQVFSEMYDGFVQQQEAAYNENRRKYLENIERENNHVKSQLSKGEIYGEKIDKQLAKEIERGIFEATEVFENNGQRQAVTQFQKFIHEFNTNPEIRVLAFKNYQFPKESSKNVKKEIKKELEEDFLKGYKTNVVKPKKQEPVTPEKKGTSFILEI